MKMLCKYIHILWADELKFNRPLVEFINSEERLRGSESLFVTPYLDVFNALKQYDNVVYSNHRNLYLYYGRRCKWLFCHDYPSKRVSLFVPLNIKRKTIYRYWGGRREERKTNTGNVWLDCSGRVFNFIYKILFRFLYGNLAAVGIANVVDEIDLRPLLPKIPLLRMPYVTKAALEAQKMISPLSRSQDGIVRVMIGHRSDPIENHIKYIDVLQKYPSDRIHIFLPMSYGDEKYREKVREYVTVNEMRNVTIMDSFLPFPEYCNFITSVDIALIECHNSLALGNVSLLVGAQKTVFLSREGVIRKAFEAQGVPFRILDEIDNSSFDDFAKLIDYPPKMGDDFMMHDYEYFVRLYYSIFEFLDNREGM